ncbi:MAG: LacI family DNA-binding transcriptional regulator [Alicyclobacillus macrosporangiidus]|uniref:LacI family DNA-binding transcriptional regulator n=1 Tax=Alicyclobacillus macrosporangiidus TaxID=392015 RepID=UPI0026F2E5F7|nr:LacI family DNA-binding transcriptional regulator [Alicyclobacillus macrosporangiidus]MCL6599207.1 LacI family DNA-binding transcriptional regulator [Alicyclobacillus macrosporangiidus]
MADRPRRDRNRPVTILHVARAAGVSKTTVSRYLSGHYHLMSDETRQKIESAIAALDYRPNQMARGLKRGRSGLVGMVVADIANPFTVDVLRGVEDECKRCGMNLLLCNTGNDPEQERAYIFMLQAHRIDGLIINTTGQNNAFLKELASDRIPIVLMDRKMPELPFDTVCVDNRQATRAGLMHLLEQGYRRIAWFTEPVGGISSRTERVGTYRKVMEQHAGQGTGDVFEVNVRVPGEVETLLAKFLSKAAGEAPAVCCANAVVALRVVQGLNTLGVRVPEDVGLVSFDNPDWAGLVYGGITAIEQPTYALGVTAMRRVWARIQAQEEMPPELIELPARLVARGSTVRAAIRPESG